MKRCSHCRLEKPVTEFNTSKAGDGFHNYCKPCSSAYYKAYNTAMKAAEQSEWVDSKECRHCHLKKPISQFGLKSNRPDKKNIYCKPCHRKLSYEALERFRAKHK